MIYDIYNNIKLKTMTKNIEDIERYMEKIQGIPEHIDKFLRYIEDL